MSMFSFSSLLDSLDNAAKETLEEPKESATQIRSKRKQSESKDNLRSKALLEDDSAESSHEQEDASQQAEPAGMIALAMEETSVHSKGTQESYVLPSSPTISAHDSDEQVAEAHSSAEVDLTRPPSLPPLPSSLAKRLTSNTSTPRAAPTSTDNDSELRKLVKKKTQEIESLNEECLVLEEQCTSLKQEVQEAWDHYKMAQEKAALREAELQDELTQLQKAKQVDKQQSVVQITKLSDDVNALIKQMQVLRDEKQELLLQVQQVDATHLAYQEQIDSLEKELKEAKMHSSQGTQSLREELLQLQRQHEMMRSEHTTLLRQGQQRQSQLEKDNSDLVQALASSQKEKLADTDGDSSSSLGNDYFSREIVHLQQELRTSQSDLERQKELRQTAEIALYRSEKDARLLQLTVDEHRSRAQESEQRLQQTIRQLEAQLTQAQSQQAIQQQQQQSVSGVRSGAFFLNSGGVEAGEDGRGGADPTRELRNQVEHLSKMLLKKQAGVLDLQAERTALRSKVGDLQGKAGALETQVVRLREQLEAAGEDYDPDDPESGGMVITPRGDGPGGLMQRRSRGSERGGERGGALTVPPSPKIIVDLEKMGVKPSAGVSKAVTMLDGLALVMGRFFRIYPLARVIFVLYLVLLHLWVFFILIVHTHALEMPSSPRDRVQNNIIRPSRGLGP